MLRRYGVTRFSSQSYPGHITASELINEIGVNVFESYFSFAIVRNPWDCQVSLYETPRSKLRGISTKDISNNNAASSGVFTQRENKFILKTTSHHQHEFVENLGGFEEYIRWRCNEEVTLQKDFIYSEDNKLLVDFVGRFERIDEDFKIICSHIGITSPVSLPKLNTSNTTPYQEYYNEDTRELVMRKFEVDVNLFGYDF
jgi:hypothetical protein